MAPDEPLPELKATAQGVVIPVRAQPGARRTGVVGVHGGRWKIAVAEPPEKGRANAALEAALAAALGVSPSRVSLLRGAGARSKEFCVSGVDVATVQARLSELWEQHRRR
jgi:uncharacterized protein YggU (UPF0235/DUF167 family)